MPLGVAGWTAIGSAAIGAVGSNMAASRSSGAAAGSSQANDLIAMQQQVQANEQWNRYKQIYAPLEDAFAQEAQNRGSVANQNKAASQAAAATTAAYANARERLSKSPGLDPSSQRYLQEMNKINLAEAASSATGQNNARDSVIQQGDAMRADALNVGKGFAAQSMQGLNSAASTNANNRNYYANQAANEAGVGAGIGRMIGGITQSRAFQNWLNSPSVDTYDSINNSALLNGYGNTFQQNGYSADIAYG